MTHVRPVSVPGAALALTLYLPGSSVWLLLELDGRYRVIRETIVNPGHLIERSFAYRARRMGVR